MSITETGYHRETFEEIVADLSAKARELFGEDIDVGEDTPLGKILSILAYVRAKDHETAEAIFYSGYPNTAIGSSLDRLAPMTGIARNPATPARYQVKVTGEAGTVIPIGFLISTESNIEFYNTTEATIEGEECTITVECVSAGTMGNVPTDDITEIVNPEAGIDSVVGLSVISVGTDEESDYSLRERMTATIKGAGAGTMSAIRAALLKVPTVTDAILIENDTDKEDGYGNPPHSITCYVSGGGDYSQEIGEAIFSTKAAGIATNGEKTALVNDIGGHSHTVKYNHTESVPVTVGVSITTNSDFWGADGIAKIKENIVSHINKIELGGEVVLSQLYGQIYAVGGVSKVTSLTLNGEAADLTLTFLQKANCTAVNVTEV